MVIPFRVLLGLVVIALAFAPTLRGLALIWSDYYVSGALIAPYALWLVWRRREELGDASRGWPLFAGIILLCSCVWLLGRIALIQIVQQAMLPLLLGSWIVAVWGPKAMRTAALVTGVFLLAVPLPMFLVPVLQAITVKANSLLIHVAGLNAVVEGNYIRLSQGVFEVAEGCAGAAFFTTALTFAVIYVTAFRTSRAASLAIIFTAIGLSLIVNWLRVFSLVLIGYWTAMKHPLVWDHGWYGWVIFAMLEVVWVWAAFQAERLWPVPENAGVHSARIHVGFPSVSRQAVALASAAACAGPLLAALLDTRPRDKAPTDVPGLVPLAFSTAKATPARWEPSGISRQVHLRALPVVQSDTLQVDRIVFVRQDQGAELIGTDHHLGDGSSILVDEMIPVPGAQLRIVRRAVVKTPDGYRLILYWYRVAGIETGLPLKAKLLEVVATLAGRAPSELLAISGACADASCRDTSELLASLLIH